MAEADDELFEDAVESFADNSNGVSNKSPTPPPPTPSPTPLTPPISPASSASPTAATTAAGKVKKKNKKGKFLYVGVEAVPEAIPLAEAIYDSKRAIDLFLNNKFDEAKNICEPLADRSMYHCLGNAVFTYMKAVMTFDQKDIEEASLVLTRACDTITHFRRKSSGLAESLGRMVRLKPADFNAYTETELHAELCFAECIQFKAALTLMEDETLVSFVKAGLKVRTCFHVYRDCWSSLSERDWSTSDHKLDFESGARLGVGAFNLMISMLPARIMKLLEFIGFTGRREAGLQELMWVHGQKDCTRQSLASLILLGYHLVICFFVGSSESDLKLCQRILDEKLEQYPDGVFFTFFKGRYHVVQGDVDEAITWYCRAVSCQDTWPQFHHICYWELFWSHMFQHDWRQAMAYADKLLDESKWSRCMYAYMKAAAMCMLQEDLSPEQRKEQIKLMKNVPRWKQRIAGKSLPMEKFAIRKAERFLDQSNRLILPALELIYVWNGFTLLKSKYRLVEAMYVIVEKEKKRMDEMEQKDGGKGKYSYENVCLLSLLQGVCLKHMKSPLQAEECFKQVISYAGKLKADHYLVPYALFEYGLLLKDQGQGDLAMQHLESAKNDFKDYSLHSRLHFRIHAAQAEYKAKQKAGGGKRSSHSKKEAKKDCGTFGDNSEPSSSSSSYHDLSVEDIMPFGNPADSAKNFVPITEVEARKILQGN